jgi:uncharacterized Zn-binding protein involved in type VI secretion
MPAIERIGDVNTGGGQIVKVPQPDVFANNLLVSINGSPVSPHTKHIGVVTASGSPDVFVHNIPVNRIGDPDTCRHTRATGSPNVFVNG